MSFEAYMDTIRAKTGKGPAEFFEEGKAAGVLRHDTRAMEFVGWLKGHAGLGHGHAMSVWEAFRRNGWLPVPQTGSPSPLGPRRGTST